MLHILKIFFNESFPYIIISQFIKFQDQTLFISEFIKQSVFNSCLDT